MAKPGRIAVLERIQDLREQHQIDLAIMNAENLAGGFSVTPSLCEQLFANGIDVMTSGNHIFDKKEAIDYIRDYPSSRLQAQDSFHNPRRFILLLLILALLGSEGLQQRRR